MSSETLSPEDVEAQLIDLFVPGLLRRKGITQHDEGNFFYSITTRGTLFAKGYIAKLSSAIKDKNISEQDIQLGEGDSAVKTHLKDPWARIKIKSKDEISNTLFSSLRTYGPPLIMMLANLAA